MSDAQTQELTHLVCTCLLDDNGPIHERLIARCGEDVTDQDEGWAPDGRLCNACMNLFTLTGCSNCRGSTNG